MGIWKGTCILELHTMASYIGRHSISYAAEDTI